MPVFIRTHAELEEIAALERFENSEIRGAHLNIIFLADNLDRRSEAKLVALTTETDGFRVRGREIYWWRRKKPGTSLFSTLPLEKVSVYDPQQEHNQEVDGKIQYPSGGWMTG